MSISDVKEARRLFAIKKNLLINSRRSDLAEAKAHYRAKGFTRAEYQQEVRETWNHFRRALAEEVQHLKDEIFRLRK